MLDTIQEMSDEKLMELYQIGDLYAFNVLYQRYEQRIYGYFHRFFPEERCADLLQETFLKVHRSRSRYKTSLPFSKWLFVIVCNLAKDEFKRLSRLKEYLDDGQLEDTRTFLVDPETPESIVEHDELWERIQQAILDLPENHREVIIQSKYEGKSYPEIAESMDITVGAVKQRAYRGLLTLREKLKDLVEPEFKDKARKGFSGIMIFKFQSVIKKVLIGGVEAMKITAKVKIVTIGVAAVLMLGGTGIIVWHHQSKQETLNPIASQISQKVATAPSKDLMSKSNPSDRYVSAHSVDQAIATQEQKGEQIKTDAGTGLVEGTLRETTDLKETPAELLQRYRKVTNSPEFMAEVDKITFPMEMEIQQTCEPIIKELEDKEKKLESDYETASNESKSKIQADLEETKSKLWETKVERTEKIILIGDAVHKVFLNHFTNEEIRIAREEMAKAGTAKAIPMDEKTKEMYDAKLITEAMARLKAKGWVPANPDKTTLIQRIAR